MTNEGKAFFINLQTNKERCTPSYIEDFSVRALAKSKHPSNSIEDASSVNFVTLLIYKTADADSRVLKVHLRNANQVRSVYEGSGYKVFECSSSFSS